jgi:hypothetical protein
MPQFLIERIMPGVAELEIDDLKQTSRAGLHVLEEHFPEIEWIQSYVTKDALYCLYQAPNEQELRRYTSKSTLPVHRISEVRATIDPATLEIEQTSATTAS